jgi:hypothetical protein
LELGVIPLTPYLMALEGRPLVLYDNMIREEDIHGKDNKDLSFPHNGTAMQVVHAVLVDIMHS